MPQPFFTTAVVVLLLLQCCSCIAFDADVIPNQLRSRAATTSLSVPKDADRNRDGRRAEIDIFSLDGFLDVEEQGDDEDSKFNIIDYATEEVVDEIVDLLQRNAQQGDTVEEREPTDFPTGLPETDEPTDAPTWPIDSDAPTPALTHEPTLVPTNMPTSAPTVVPTSTDEPTNELTASRNYEEKTGAESVGSNAPTALSPLTRDASPAMTPIIKKSESRNNTTILSPRVGHTNSSVVATNSSMLTDEPTTVSPTKVPTSSPTANPSSSPTTAFPTFSPTPACHDKRTYRSPINGLGCEQHVGSDCERWRHIGLTNEQVVELHSECPVACRTDCE
jgi:hypothetical protein